MIRRGAAVEPPPFAELRQNADDATVVSLLSDLLGISANRTDVPQEQSRGSYAATIKHTYFYLFQKQGLIANKEQLFYRQNEQFLPQAIKDTLPILLGVAPDDRLEIDSKLRAARRELKITQKQLSEAQQFSEQLSVRALGLLSEAQQVGLFARGPVPETNRDALDTLSEITRWKPAPVPDEDTRRISELEDNITVIRKERAAANETLRATQLFAEKEDGFTTEAQEQKSRLESIHALPTNTESGDWQWPFAPVNLGLDTPIGESLIQELRSLDHELETVVGERPHLEEFTQRLESQILDLNKKLRSKEEELSAAISANAAIAEMGNRNAAAARTIGRISLFLETYRPEDDLAGLKTRMEELQGQVTQLERDSGANDSDERLTSILNIISNRINRYVAELEAEFSEFPFRFDLNQLTVVADRPERPVPMNKTGGGANHLAYHLGAMLALHHFTSNNRKPVPSFLFLDQPTQVYFPSEQIYKAGSGSVAETERDSDLEKVRKLFAMLHRFASEESKGFQIIVTEHANLRDEWFQDSIVEVP
jgi:vacuolar-type H+-ATPase subunit I/STV1